MTFTYQQEPWSSIESEIAGLIGAHWEEIAVNKDKIALNLDYGVYRELERIGMLHVTTVRADGRLVGYYGNLVRPHPHYRTTKFAFLDGYFLLGEFRNAQVGVRLFQEMEKAMRAIGVECIYTGVKLHRDVGPLLERLGWKPTEMMYAKYTGAK